jgi:hypothetical protein
MASLGLAWRWLTTKTKAVWRWLLDNPVALASAIGGLVGAYLMWKSRQNRVSELEDAILVQASRTKIAKAEATAELLEKQSDGLEPRVVELKKQIVESKRRVLEIHDGASVQELSDEDIAKRFSEAGL